MDDALISDGFGSLRLERLPADGVYLIHYIHPGEAIGARLRRVRKGTLVFATPDGTPILVAICGNPMRGGPVTAFATTNQVIPDFNADEAPGPVDSTFTVAQGGPRSAIPGGEPTVSVAIEPSPPISAIIPPLHGGASNLAAWATLGVIPLLFTHGGGNTPTPHLPVVPEPGALSLIAAAGLLAAAGLAAWLIRRARCTDA